MGGLGEKFVRAKICPDPCKRGLNYQQYDDAEGNLDFKSSYKYSTYSAFQ